MRDALCVGKTQQFIFTKQITRYVHVKNISQRAIIKQAYEIDVRDVRIQSHCNDVGVEESAVAENSLYN